MASWSNTWMSTGLDTFWNISYDFHMFSIEFNIWTENDLGWSLKFRVIIIQTMYDVLNTVSRDWLPRGQKDIWNSSEVNPRKPEYIWPAIRCCCKTVLSCSLISHSLPMLHLYSYCLLYLNFLAGFLGSNCTCLWER